MPRRTYIEEIQDPVTGETVVLEADTEQRLDALLAERFPEGPDAEPA